MTLFVAGQLLLGLVLLTVGAEALVRGAARLAAMLGISSLIVGLTVVAFGTSAPELAVSTQAAWVGNGGIAIGNVVGSNIFNVLFILGLSALVVPLVVDQQLVRLDVPLMIAASVLLLIFALDGVLTRIEGGVLFAGIVAYTAFLIRQSRRQREPAPAPDVDEFSKVSVTGWRAWRNNLLFIGIGLILLVLGARWLVEAAVAIARSLGVSDLIIGLTIIAAGTSLPEAATSIMASLRGERDIAVGNIVGSNLFNILTVMGVAALIAPAPIEVPAQALVFDLPVMLVVAIATLPIFFTGHRVSRGEGLLFFGYYLAYTTYLVLQSTGHGALATFENAMLYFALPLTAITLLVLVVREWKVYRTE